MSQDRTARAFWVTGPGASEIRTESLPVCQDGQIVVRCLYSGISRGTETMVFRGEVPASEHTRMRAPFQAGDFPGPVKYGYAAVGEVTEGPQALLDRRVFCLHPHQTEFVVPASAVQVIPEGVPAARAILAANLETAINGLWDAQPGVGDRVAVIGAGSVGCLVAWLLRQIPGCQVQLIDTRPARHMIAQRLGLAFSLPEQAVGECDLVFHTSGNPAGLQTALDLAGQEARLIEMSWFGQRTAHLQLGESFHSRRLTIQSSQVGEITAGRRSRWSFQRRLSLALSLLESSELDALISDQSHFNDLPEVMAKLSTEPGNSIFHRIAYPSKD